MAPTDSPVSQPIPSGQTLQRDMAICVNRTEAECLRASASHYISGREDSACRSSMLQDGSFLSGLPEGCGRSVGLEFQLQNCPFSGIMDAGAPVYYNYECLRPGD
jgi:hypothetical protein